MLYPISFNQDYADAFLCSELCSLAFSETMINEITVYDRCALLEIDIQSKKIEQTILNYNENTIEPDSKEGLEIIDNWYEKWITLIKSHSNRNFQFDLTGGMDSRLTFLLLLGSEIEHDTVLINSINDNMHCHAADYKIATEIANEYNFKLNNENNVDAKPTKFSPKDLLNMSFYSKLGVHKFMRYTTNTDIYRVGGACGELIRSYWSMTEDEFIKEKIDAAKNRYRKSSKKLVEKLCVSTEKILRKSFQQIREKYANYNQSIQGQETQCLYKEVRCRNHFGKIILESYLMGVPYLYPLGDLELNKLKINSQSCSDTNLLLALIFSRYSDLLKFPFEGDRIIDNKTLEYAKSINVKNPYIKKGIMAAKQVQQQNTPNNKEDKSYVDDYINNLIVEIFHSKQVKKLFKKTYGFQMYGKIDRIRKRAQHEALWEVFSTISICKALKDIELSNSLIRNDIIKELLK